MAVEDSVTILRQIDFKEVNSKCSQNNLSLRVDDYSRQKFDKALKTAYLLVTQPIEIAIPRETKTDTINSIKDVKKVLDSLYLLTKDQKYKSYLDALNEIMSHRKVR